MTTAVSQPSNHINDIANYQELNDKLQPSTGRISIPTRGSYKYVDLRDIVYIEADSNYTRLYLKDDKSLYVSKTLKYWTELIDSELFIRIHSKYLVNSVYVTQLETKNSRLIVQGTTLIISRSRKSYVIKQMQDLSYNTSSYR